MPTFHSTLPSIILLSLPPAPPLDCRDSSVVTVDCPAPLALCAPAAPAAARAAPPTDGPLRVGQTFVEQTHNFPLFVFLHNCTAAVPQLSQKFLKSSLLHTSYYPGTHRPTEKPQSLGSQTGGPTLKYTETGNCRVLKPTLKDFNITP